jgi:hypothetical protein
MFAALLGSATSLLPIFARDIFRTLPEGPGALQLWPRVFHDDARVNKHRECGGIKRRSRREPSAP